MPEKQHNTVGGPLWQPTPQIPPIALDYIITVIPAQGQRPAAGGLSTAGGGQAMQTIQAVQIVLAGGPPINVPLADDDSPGAIIQSWADARLAWERAKQG